MYEGYTSCHVHVWLCIFILHAMYATCYVHVHCLLQECGPLEERGIVMGVLDKAFEVLVLKLGVVKRVYMDVSSNLHTSLPWRNKMRCNYFKNVFPTFVEACSWVIHVQQGGRCERVAAPVACSERALASHAAAHRSFHRSQLPTAEWQASQVDGERRATFTCPLSPSKVHFLPARHQTSRWSRSNVAVEHGENRWRN